ncbi:MAG: butyrate kinase, partial [bacterium]|nr:butyrate kinase [bacterium]
MSEFILAINPGSTSTKLTVFNGDELTFEMTLRHAAEDLATFDGVAGQYAYRRQMIETVLQKKGFDIASLAAVVGRGGLLRPISGGTYLVTNSMIADLTSAVRGEHASNLGGLLAKEIADRLGIDAYIVDPVVVDELEPVARLSGHPAIERKSIFHALNQKAVARKYAEKINAAYDGLNLVVAHLGGGVSVGAHRRGKVIDVNNALDGDGPFSPERSGGLPVGDLVRL